MSVLPGCPYYAGSPKHLTGTYFIDIRTKTDKEEERLKTAAQSQGSQNCVVGGGKKLCKETSVHESNTGRKTDFKHVQQFCYSF